LPIKARRTNARFGAFCLAVLISGAAAAAPSQKAEIREQQNQLQQRIDALRQELARSEESRAYAADQLKETESAISTANRSLHQLAEQRSAVQAEARELDSQAARLADQTAIQQNQLSRLLYRRYTRGDTDALQLLLAGRDPNQTALDHQFLKRLSLARAELIAGLRGKLREKQRLTAAAHGKNAELAAIERQQQAARAALIEQQRQRQSLLARTADKIKAQRQEIGALQRDEKRLARLLEGLTRLVGRSERGRQTGSPDRHAPAPIRNEVMPDAATGSGVFATLKGKLHLPVRGDVIGRFGKPRAEGGATWKGLFIRAAEGTEVKAIAAGQVVFADWLRGFGNLMVLDHGDGFLSVYGNNQSLLRETGRSVQTGETVATVGNSGGNPESGLYFELRHQGQAFDPLRWVSTR
jgi:septal ring factor EnvC (AmiA/AmiB activator)